MPSEPLSPAPVARRPMAGLLQAFCFSHPREAARPLLLPQPTHSPREACCRPPCFTQQLALSSPVRTSWIPAVGRCALPHPRTDPNVRHLRHADPGTVVAPLHSGRTNGHVVGRVGAGLPAGSLCWHPTPLPTCCLLSLRPPRPSFLNATAIFRPIYPAPAFLCHL